MKVEREDLGALKYRLTIELEPADVRKHRERLARAYSHHVNLRGFRPGKAPIEMVIRQLGPSLEMEVREHAVGQAFQDALKEHGLRPSTDPKVDVSEPAEDGAIKFTEEFETYPAVEVKDYLCNEVE
jgi:trigger factor